MTVPGWLRYPSLFLLNAALFSALVWGGLKLTGRFLTVAHDGGDQSQTSAVDLSPVHATAPLPLFPDADPRNVILIIGDGVGFSHVLLGRSELGRMNEKLFFERFPVTGWHTTHAVDSVYTDSASSASSLATGHKVPYGTLSETADGRRLRTVAEAARDRGIALGAITDSYLWDATPAAFLSHAPSRRDIDSINTQMAGSGVLVLAGESHDALVDRDPEDGRNVEQLVEEFRHGGFRVARSGAELAEIPVGDDQPLLGLFPPGAIADPAQSPRLVDLARYAIERLSTSEGGFFLVIETEEADSGAHRRDASRIVRAIESIDEIAAVAVEHALGDRSTLVLITADHETGGIDILHGDDEHTLGVRWSTSSHSAEPVPIYAFGAGAERFSGVKDNTEVAHTLSDLLGLEMFP